VLQCVMCVAVGGAECDVESGVYGASTSGMLQNVLQNVLQCV